MNPIYRNETPAVSPIKLIFWLCIFFPWGLYLMWKNSAFTPKARLVITGLFAVLYLHFYHTQSLQLPAHSPEKQVSTTPATIQNGTETKSVPFAPMKGWMTGFGVGKVAWLDDFGRAGKNDVELTVLGENGANYRIRLVDGREGLIPMKNVATSSYEAESRNFGARGETIRSRYTNGVFVSSMVEHRGDQYIFNLAVNDSQWEALDLKHQHQLVTFVLNDFRKEFCRDNQKICTVKLLGMYDRKLASSKKDMTIQIEK